MNVPISLKIYHMLLRHAGRRQLFVRPTEVDQITLHVCLFTPGSI